MTDKDKKRIIELKQLIAKYDTQYYENGVSDISDAEYDRLYDEYLSYEQQHPELKEMEDAPSKRVGAGKNAGTTTGLPKFTHKSPLLSIDRKAKELSELKDFYEKVGGDGVEVLVQPKLDGITCNVNYEHGEFVNAATRGNGYIGDLITANFKNTDTKYPKEIGGDASIELRGEAIISYDFFHKHLQEEYSNPRNAVAGIMRQIDPQEVKGKGVQVMFYDFGQTEKVMLERSDSNNVDFMKCLGFQSVPVEVVDTWEKLEEIVVSKMHERIQNIDGFNVLVDEHYPQAVCDGLVIKVNDRRLREEIGMSEKGPKWAFAFKFKPLQAQTRIDHVEWQVGKSGKVTPVAVFDEVSLGGTKITRATLNNYDYMQTMPVQYEYREIEISEPYDIWRQGRFYGKGKPFTCIQEVQEGDILSDTQANENNIAFRTFQVAKMGDEGFWITDIENDGHYNGAWVPFDAGRFELIPKCGLGADDVIVVERSNDVIPRVVNVLYRQHTNNTRYPSQTYLETQNNGSGIPCYTSLEEQARMESFNAPSICPVCGSPLEHRFPLHFCLNNFCPSQMKAKIEHYASRDAMNIVGLGEGIIDVLYKEGFLPDIPSIYTLASHSDELENLPKFGKRKVQKLLMSVEDTKHPELWQFIYALSIEGVGKKTAKDLAQRFHTLDDFLQASQQELTEIQDIGEIVAMQIHNFIDNPSVISLLDKLRQAGVEPKPVEISGDTFKGMTFVITGTLPQPRSYYQNIIEKNGGKVAGSVSKKTTVVIIGEDAGSKEAKARKLVQEGAPITLVEGERVMEFLGE